MQFSRRAILPAVLALLGLVLFYSAWQWQKRQRYQSASPYERGWLLVEAHGCADCHQPGNSLRAPDLRELLGQKAVLQDGSELVVDADYIKTALLQPKRHVRVGYQAVMPSYEGRFSAEELEAFLAAFGPAPHEP